MNKFAEARAALEAARAAARAAGEQKRFWPTRDIDPAVKNVIMITAGNRLMLDALDALLEQAFIQSIEHDEDMINPHVAAAADAILIADKDLKS